MTFQVSYVGIPAGKVQVTVGSSTALDGHTVWPIVLFAKTESVFSLYRVRDKFVTFWDPVAQRPIANDFFADEGGKKRRQRVEFDHGHGKARILRQFETEPSTDEVWEVPAGSLDACAAMYALRLVPLKAGDAADLPVFTGRVAFTLHVTAEAEEAITVPAGTFPALRVILKHGFAGWFASSEPMRAWVSADDLHVPLRIEGSFVLGTLTAELIDYRKGLGGPVLKKVASP